MKSLILTVLVFFVAPFCSAKPGSLKKTGSISKEEFQRVVEHCETKLPKLWASIQGVREQGVDIRITDERKGGPGKSSGTDLIVLSSWFLTNNLAHFPEDRLVIVLLHELGHIVFNREKPRGQRNPVLHEFAAFSYSLLMAKKMAEKGDYGPLEQVIRNLELRSKRGRPRDPHTIALKQLIGNPLWNECAELLSEQSEIK